MKLRGINFGCVFDHSGVRNFGNGYWYHKYLKRWGLDFTGSTFVAKTTTLNPNKGNLPLEIDGETPKELMPQCIVVKPLKGVVLNAVGLSGPGARFLFRTGKWYQITKPFMLSFMSIAKTSDKRLDELFEFVQIMRTYLPFRAPCGLQINFTCSNVGLHLNELYAEIPEALSIAQSLGIPLVPKLNVLVPVSLAREVAKHPACDALCTSNTIPWGVLPDRIDWKGLFGSDKSPLAHLDGGGLSGKPLLPLVVEWVKKAKRTGISKPIIAGGGILGPKDVDQVHKAGADAVALCSIALLRPWRVRKTIRHARGLYGQE